jgi:hypothetical protein
LPRPPRPAPFSTLHAKQICFQVYYEIFLLVTTQKGLNREKICN